MKRADSKEVADPVYAAVELTDAELTELERRLEELGAFAEKVAPRPGTTLHLLHLGLVPETSPRTKRPRRAI